MQFKNNGSNYTYLSGWQSTAYAKDLNSIQGDPNFISYDNLSGGSSSAITFGDVTTGIAIDITNTARTRYLMGAYDYSVSLPVQFILIKASKLYDNANITWSTATEINNKGFEIQRSVNKSEFKTIGFIKGHDTSNRVLTYTFADQNVFATQRDATIYYRLKQIDFDGTYSYSDVVSVSGDQKSTPTDVLAYPNPFHSEITIITGYAQVVSFGLKDISGKDIQTSYISTANNSFAINTDHLNPGVYFLSVHFSNGSQTLKIVKTN